MKTDPTLFPESRIEATGEISRRLRDLDLTDLQEAVRYVRDLPYGRTESRSDFGSVLDEGVGTCSTKHALLAHVCEQQGIDDIQLTLGMYEMNEHNTPGVGAVLAGHGLEYIPEAHCYLKYKGDRFDFTRADTDTEPITRVLVEEPIRPSQIGEYKIERHRTFLADWIDTTECDLTLDELWHIREACIEQLSRSTVP